MRTGTFTQFVAPKIVAGALRILHAPIQIDVRLGHNSGSTLRSGTSTSEKRIGLSGDRPGGATV